MPHRAKPRSHFCFWKQPDDEVSVERGVMSQKELGLGENRVHGGLIQMLSPDHVVVDAVHGTCLRADPDSWFAQPAIRFRDSNHLCGLSIEGKKIDRKLDDFVRMRTQARGFNVNERREADVRRFLNFWF